MAPRMSIAELIRAFLNGATTGISYGSMMIRGHDKLCSYAEVICERRKIGDVTYYVLMSPIERNSVTTAKHMSRVYKAVRTSGVMYVDETPFARYKKQY